MFSVSEKYSKAIVADTRDMPYRVTLAGVIVLDQSKIPNMTLTESASGNSSLSIGTANSASLKLTLRDADVVDYNDVLVEPESGLVLPDGSIEWLPLGKFWVTNSTTNNDYKTVTLNCADGMYHLTGDFESELTYPTTLKAFVNELVAKTGIAFVGLDSLPNVIIRRKSDKMTYRDAFGYAAGCCGKNARFNREGMMEFFWYSDTGITIERETQYLNGMTRLNDKPLNVTFEVTGKQETYTVTCVSDGSGGVTATPGRNVLEGETVVISINPFSGFELASISAVADNGVEVTLYKDAEGGYTFIQPDSDVTITASFRGSAEGPFKLTVRAYDGGSINYGISENEAGYSYFNMGDTVTIFVTPHSGFEIDKLITTPANITFSEAGTTDEGDIVYEFTMPQSDVTINAYFKESDTYYTIERIVDQGGLPTTPGYIVIENHTTPGSLYKEGDVISVCFARTQGHVFDSYEANVDMVQIDNDEFQFVMPANNVSITAHFKWEEDESKAEQFSWLAPPSNNTPPTPKPYWAVFYKYSPSVPTCKRYYLVWFDSWSATSYNSDGYGKQLYNIKFNGYYYCGSQDTWHYPHAWDTANWSGNGASGSTLEWDTFVGGYTWAGDAIYGGDYCLLASNIHLYYNSTLLFKMCPNAIKFPAQGYRVDGMDVRERGALGYYKCPDTFSTPAPASNWMILNSHDSLLMNVDENGNYNGYGDGWTGLFVVWFDDIAVENVGAVFDNSDEEFYIATVTNGRYVGLCRDGGTWGTLREVGENQVIGIRNPTISESYSYGLLGTYYFNGLVACSRDISSSGNLLRYKNDCKICDCVSTFLFRSRATSNVENVTITYTNPLIYEKMVPTISEFVQGVTYTPAKVKHRGNPAFQPGDILTVPDRNGEYHTVLIMQQTMTFGGGMNSELVSYGQTENQSNFPSNGPITAQIKQTVKQANDELEHRLSANNALVFASLHRTIGNTESKIKSVVEWQTEQAATIAALEQTASEHEATIEAQAEILTETAHALASIEQTVNQYGAEIISQAELIGLNTKSISSVSERVTATEAELSGVAEWRENMDMANSNIIRNSRGEFNLTSNVLVISSTEFAIVNGKIESDALTVTTDENTIHVVSDAINMWGDGEYLVTPRTQRVKASTEYTVSFEFCPSTDSVGVNVVWLSDTTEDRKEGQGYVKSTNVGASSGLVPNEWQRIIYTFVTPSDDYTGYLKFSGDGKIAKIKMEKGDAFTGYIPHVEDAVSSVALINQRVSAAEASIDLQAQLNTANSISLSRMELRVAENEASIGLLVDNGKVKGSILVEAINDESYAKISADNILFEGQKLDIKVDATNIEGSVTAEALLAKRDGVFGSVVVDALGVSILDENFFTLLSEGYLTIRGRNKDGTFDSYKTECSKFGVTADNGSYITTVSGNGIVITDKNNSVNDFSITRNSITFTDGTQLTISDVKALLKLLRS